MIIKECKITLKINKDDYEIHNIDELRHSLNTAKQEEYLEIWLFQDNNGSMSLLSNKDRAWLMYLRFEGDVGFSSRNVSYIGLQNAELDFYLSNGQKDNYPESWTVSIEDAFRALEYFYLYSDKAPFITWHDDSSS